MIATSIIELLDILRSLIGRKAELDEKFFHDFVEPAWKAFEKVHNDYKESFSEYAKVLSDGNFQESSLIDKIKRDSILTMDLRSELFSMVSNLPKPYFSLPKANTLESFIRAITAYLRFEYVYPTVGPDNWRQDWLSMPERVGDFWKTDDNEPLLPKQFLANVPRGMLTSYLIRNAGNKNSVNRIINHILSQLQEGYSEVATEYHEVRKKMLA